MQSLKQKRYWISSLLIITFYSCQKKQYSACFQSAQHYALKKDTADEKSALSNLVSSYQQKLSTALQEPIASCALPLSKAQPESNLGNLIADAVLSISNSGEKVDAAIIHYNSIHKEYLAPGNITPKDIFELFPNNDKIILLSVPGALLQQICDSIAQFKGMPIAGIKMKIANNNRASNIEIKQQPLKENLVYTIAVNQSLLQSRPFKTILGHIGYTMTSLHLRSTLIAYLKNTAINQHSITPLLDNRISYAE